MISCAVVKAGSTETIAGFDLTLFAYGGMK